MATHYIYGLHDVDGTLRYVGASTKPQKRLGEYKNSTRRNLLFHWLASLESPPRLSILRAVRPEEDWRDAERRCIDAALLVGCPLVNSVHNPAGKSDRTRPLAPIPAWMKS